MLWDLGDDVWKSHIDVFLVGGGQNPFHPTIFEKEKNILRGDYMFVCLGE